MYRCPRRNGINYQSIFDEQCLGNGNKYKFVLQRHFGYIMKKHCKTCKIHHRRIGQDREREALCDTINYDLPEGVKKPNLGWKRRPPAAIG